MSAEPLFDTPAPQPRLTPKQQAALAHLRQAGADGLHADEVGAYLHALRLTGDGRWAHAREVRCQYCGRDGLSMLYALRRHGLVKQRRPRGLPPYWQVDGLTARGVPNPAGMLADDEALPF